MWITSDFLEWPAELKRSRVHSEKRVIKRPYQILRYAEQVFEEGETGSAGNEIMATLRRVIDNRIRALEAVYAFNAIPIQDKPNDPIVVLEYIGVIKSFLCRILVDIRHDLAPPTFEGYGTHIEFVWYFLRITDGMLVKTPLVMGFPRPASLDVTSVSYEVSITIDPQGGWSPKIRGLLEDGMISSKPISQWIEVKSEKIEEKDIPKQASTSMEGGTDHFIYVEGTIRGPDIHLRKLLNIYFSLA